MRLIVLLMFLGIADIPLFSQVTHNSELYRVLRTQDSLLFNVGFNTCDIKQFENLISENFEFYHDKSGIIASKNDFITSIKDGICNLNYKAKRVLDLNSLEVYSIEKNGVLYGAIQTGLHRFYAIEKNKPEYLTSTALFTHVWLLENGDWKLSRALSYNHQEPETKPVSTDSLIFIDRQTTEYWLNQTHIPALGIGYIQDGKIKVTNVFGKNEDGKPYAVNTIFNVASLTKPITAMVALKLVNEGKWDLDEPIYKYWTDPDVADDPRSKNLTTRHILSHQTGFPNWRWELPNKKLAFEFDPGTKYQYSGEGFEYLRKALESKFHTTLDKLAGDLIFKPLDMYDTHFYWDSTVDESRFAKWHDDNGYLYKTYKNNSANAADDLLTTVEDYCKFMVYIINGAGLKPDLYQQMISKQTRVKPRQYFGLGWLIDEDVNNGENAITHGGDDIGVHTIIFILPKSKKGLLIFTNCDNGTDIYIPTIQHFLHAVGQEIIDIETK